VFFRFSYYIYRQSCTGWCCICTCVATRGWRSLPPNLVVSRRGQVETDHGSPRDPLQCCIGPTNFMWR
jgi:hypothetical protein